MFLEAKLHIELIFDHKQITRIYWNTLQAILQMLLQYFSIAEVYLEGGQSPSPPEFDRSVKPIQTRVADYAPYTTASPPDSKSYLHLR